MFSNKSKKRIIVFLFLSLFLMGLEGECGKDRDKMEKREILYIVPFDKVTTEVLTKIGEALEDQLPLEFKIRPPEDIPAESYNKRRKQHLSSFHLDFLRTKYAAPGRRLLGVTDYDL